MHCEFSVTTDGQPARSKTFFALLFSQRYVTVARRGRASARQVIVQINWMHSYDVARNMATVLMMFRRRLLISLLQLTADQSLFKRVLNNELHVLQPLLPDKTNSCYKLHRRKHDRQLIRKSAHLNDSFIRCENVVQRLIFTFLFFYETFRPNCMSLFTCLCLVAVCQLFLYEYMDMDMEFLYVR